MFIFSLRFRKSFVGQTFKGSPSQLTSSSRSTPQKQHEFQRHSASTQEFVSRALFSSEFLKIRASAEYQSLLFRLMSGAEQERRRHISAHYYPGKAKATTCFREKYSNWGKVTRLIAAALSFPNYWFRKGDHINFVCVFDFDIGEYTQNSKSFSAGEPCNSLYIILYSDWSLCTAFPISIQTFLNDTKADDSGPLKVGF